MPTMTTSYWPSMAGSARLYTHMASVRTLPHGRQIPVGPEGRILGHAHGSLTGPPGS